jgi:uncharacterized membrane protein YfcA
MSTDAEPNWKWHPVMRLLGGVLGALCIGVVLFALYFLPQALREGQWKAALILAAFCVPAAVLGRLFLIGAWTGEEPIVGRVGDD